MDDKLRKICWEINDNTTIPGRIGNNVFQHEHWFACSSNDLMIPLLSDQLSSVKLLNPYRKFGEILREKGLRKIMGKLLEYNGTCVINGTLGNQGVFIGCYKTNNNYGCQDCLYFKENLRDILNLGGEEMLKRMHRRLERLESFRMKGKEGTFLK